MYSKGTFVSTDPDLQPKANYEQNFVLTVRKEFASIAVCYFDISTMQCYLGQFEDDTVYSSLRTLLSQIRPVEIVIERDSLASDLVKMLKNQPTPPLFTVYSPDQCLSLAKTQIAVDTYIVNSASPIPENYAYISEFRLQ